MQNVSENQWKFGGYMQCSLKLSGSSIKSEHKFYGQRPARLRRMIIMIATTTSVIITVYSYFYSYIDYHRLYRLPYSYNNINISQLLHFEQPKTLSNYVLIWLDGIILYTYLVNVFTLHKYTSRIYYIIILLRYSRSNLIGFKMFYTYLLFVWSNY